MTYTLEGLRKEGVNRLNGIIEDAEFDSLQLLLFCFNLNNTSFLLKKHETAVKQKVDEYFSLISSRASGDPLQYIIKDQIFLNKSYNVGEGVLIPRPETEELAVLCINEIKKRGYKIIFDLCAGSGCLGISIAEHCPDTTVYLFEKYDGAIKYLCTNIPKYLKNRVNFIKADIFNFDASSLPLPDLIVSNPPYIPSSEIHSLQKEVLREPITALDGGEDGLDFYRCIISRWLPIIKKGGFAAFECGENQTKRIADMFPSLLKSNIIRDIYRVERFITVEI